MIDITKIIDFLKELIPIVTGWFMAKQDSKIEQLKEENETLKEYTEIDNKSISVDTAYDGLFGKQD